jgi:hypothetical protein
MQSTITAAHFDIDDQFGPVAGIHDPAQTWNGCAVPYFPLESVRVIQDAANVWAVTDTDYGTVITVDDDGVWQLDVEYADEVTDARGQLVATITVDGVTYYAVGGWSWAWQFVADIEPCSVCDRPISEGDEPGSCFMDNGTEMPVCSVACTTEFYANA